MPILAKLKKNDDTFKFYCGRFCLIFIKTVPKIFTKARRNRDRNFPYLETLAGSVVRVSRPAFLFV